MKLDYNISTKTASVLAVMMALGAIIAPIHGHAQETPSADCHYKQAKQTTILAPAPESPVGTRPIQMQMTAPLSVPSSPPGAVALPVQIFQAVPLNRAKSVTALAAAPVVPQPSSTAKQNPVNSGPAFPESAPSAPHLPTETGEVGQLLENPAKLTQVETVATTPKPAMQEMMKSTKKITPDTPDLWRNVLVNHTKQDASGLVRFDYAGLSAAPDDMAALSSYIEEMTAKAPSTFARAEAMAYWANLYNALTVQVVAENFPVKSIRDIKSGWRAGPWKRDLVTVEGETLGLDNIEHDIMRPTFGTPLVHYMVNCASVGCPNLKETPWQAATLDADLDQAARAFINSPRGAMSDRGRLQVSSIYKWFEEDFGGDQAGVLAHLTQYADEDLAAKLVARTKIDKYSYDWGVNAP